MKWNKTSEKKPADEKNYFADMKLFLSYIRDLLLCVIGVVLVFSFLFRMVIVSGSSMCQTFIDGDCLLLISNAFYAKPKYGDIIVASKESHDNGAPIIKRIIATEGQTVDIDFVEGVVYVDGTALDEPYTNTPTNLAEGMEFPLTVDDGCVFVMGDNRNISKDSRSTEIGLIDHREIVGKAIFLMLPGTDKGNVDRDFNRIGAIS